MRNQVIKILVVLLAYLHSMPMSSASVNNESDPVQIQVNVQMCPVRNTGNTPQRMPVKAPIIGYDNERIYLYGQFAELQITLRTESEILYTTCVPAGTDVISLPNGLAEACFLDMQDDRFLYTATLTF